MSKYPTLPNKKYDVVYADFPWYYAKESPGVKYVNSAARHYNLIPDDEILKFPLKQLMNPNGIALLWATCPRLDIAMMLGMLQPLIFKGVPFIWVKTNQDGTLMGAKGMVTACVKPTTELVLAFSNGMRGPKPVDMSIRQVVFAERREHSRKPDEIYDLIEKLYPTETKLELFARTRRDGWDQWGDEVGMFS